MTDRIADDVEGLLHSARELFEIERRDKLSADIKRGMAAKKALGVPVRRNGDRSALAKRRKAEALSRADALLPTLKSLAGLSTRAIAATLNSRGIPTATGNSLWRSSTVWKVLERLELAREVKFGNRRRRAKAPQKRNT
jgi:hypothetical protein